MENIPEVKEINLPIPGKKARVLVVDDDRFYLLLYSDFLKELGCETLAVDNGLEALEKARDFRPDLAILDVVMPGISGFDVARRLREDPLTAHVPFIIVTSLADKPSRVRGLEEGAAEFLSKPFDENEFTVRVRNLLKVKHYEDYLVEHGKMLEVEVNDKSAKLEQALQKIRHAYAESVYRLTLAAEYRDKETGGHIRRISLYSQLLARYLGLEEALVETIFFASPMHDVGKIGIPDSILLKRGKHTEEESAIMRRHTVIGADILSNSDSDILIAGQEIALTHHECWDGSGYPRGLKGDEIPLSGQIVHVVDIYDALRSRRPYKEPFDHITACQTIDGQAPRFSPLMLKAFHDCADEFKRLFDEHCDDKK